MHTRSEKLNPREIGTLLRGEAETISVWSEKWNTQRLALHVGVIIFGTGLYGAAMGWWRDPQQALYVAIKFPLIILLTTIGNSLINAMFAPLLGLNIPFRQSFCAIVMSFTIAAAILGAFSPLIAFMIWNAPPISPQTVTGTTYSFIKLINVGVIAFAGMTGNVRLFHPEIFSFEDDIQDVSFWRRTIWRLIPEGWFYQNQMNCARTTVEYYLPVVDANAHTVSPELLRRAQAVLADHEKHWTLFNFLEEMLLPANGAFEGRLAYRQSSVDLARVAVALERYHLAHGEYPETLAALAPQFIEKIPHDVIGGQPLHYRRTDDGQFVLYSVGWNETDDGGVVSFSESGSVDPDKGDWVWRYPAK